MAGFDVAHIREQGVELIIVPLDAPFGRQTTGDRAATIAALQRCATAAGLAGTVVPVWDAGDGRMASQAPPNWHPFFKSIDLGFVARNVNRHLTCG
jgi:hypothetical protein